ncbi:ArsR family transcriptional regulator [Candidatus Bathyarchaeota archaeon]|nr:ArsR family transcriptional regulator [Candidatus Bathyarchaeota archaeon]
MKEAFHPNAYLQHVKNVKSGLKARTRILNALETRPSDATSIAKYKSLSYGVVTHHLRLLESEGIVNRKGKRPYVWLLTGLGQKRLLH